MTTVLTIGTFDLPHWGHFRFLQRVMYLGTKLVVGVNSDRFVESFKGTTVMNFRDRAQTLATLGYHVVMNDGPGRACIETIQPDVLAIGSDWARRDYLAQIDVTQEWLDELDITVAYVPYTKGVSTTELRRRVVDLHSDHSLSR